MMKPIVMILLLVGCTFSALANDGPAELKNLQAIRAKKIKKIDDAYVKALEKLKVKYTKRGDLESANAINAELQMMAAAKDKIDEANVSKDESEKSTPGMNSAAEALLQKEKSREVEGGVIAFVPTNKIQYGKAQEDAKKYGGVVFSPDTRDDVKELSKILANGTAGWLDVGVKLVDEEFLFETSSGKPDVDYTSTYIPFMRYRKQLDSGKPCTLTINSGGKFISCAKTISQAGYYIFIPTEADKH